MGENQSKIAHQKQSNVEDIYSMFKESNSVIIRALQSKNASLTRPKIKNIKDVVSQLLEPFQENQTYIWGAQIYINFQKYFLPNFQMLWLASREQFYQLLLTNCKLSNQDLQAIYKHYGSFQNSFFKIAAQQLSIAADMSLLQDREEHFLKNLHTLTIIGEEIQNEPIELSNSSMKQCELRIEQKQPNQRAQNNILQKARRLNIESSGVFIPQNLLINRLSLETIGQFSDLTKFYKQFAFSLQETFFSNNLVSCPLKNFLFCFETRIALKKIKMAKEKELQLTNSSEENRKMYKKREANNNFLLIQTKKFINAYTNFLWMFFQLHLMETLNLSKIINFQVIYGIVFKHVWSFIDWIVDRGYQIQESQLQGLASYQSTKSNKLITLELMKKYIFLIDQLRNERHPQEYLKKVIIFYRQVSKRCRNADELLAVYEQALVGSIKRKGSKSLALFRMRNIIQKLLIVSSSQLRGGQIGYSWTNWCIVIEILKEKVSSKNEKKVKSQKQKSELATSGTKANTIQQRFSQQKVTKIQ